MTKYRDQLLRAALALHDGQITELDYLQLVDAIIEQILEGKGK